MGCPFQGRCNDARDAFTRKQYCSSSHMAQKCPYRPKNYGNEKVRRNYQYNRSNHESINIFWVVIGIILVVYIITKLL